ncbi:CRISPR-associated helicase Cas3' [Acetivibrio straminisolvens]|jgi:CRISPR-associated endonuclease/helicase Cas3|uniref:CRISPR-associated helicase Cas3' n=1 Tax=Acetivibrio straminisolvens TaxID=253314 RepID=UPI00223EE838|nr:CRISPR-associated helicase Cas3' [Acetivibrio straminisolvens]
MLLSHPGKPLLDHLKNVFLIGDCILMRKKTGFENFSEEDVRELNRLNLLTHDLGKATSYFQYYIRSVDSNSQKNDEKKRHGLLSGVLSFKIVNTVMKNEILAFLSYMVVSKHHGELDNFANFISVLSGDEKNKTLLKQQFESIDRGKLQEVITGLGIDFDISNYTVDEFGNDIDYLTSRKVRNKVKELMGFETFLLINFLFSLLIFSDKLEAIYNSENINIEDFIDKNTRRPKLSSDCVDKFKEGLEVKNIRMAEWRNKAYQDVLNSVENLPLEEKILSINLPTGSGKTLTALKAALRLKERLIEEKGYNPRIIYVLPFTSIIEQNFDVFQKVLGTTESNVLLKHHYLSQRVYQWEKEGEMESLSDSVSEHLVESWDSEIVVSTFVQLLHSIFTNRNRKLKKFHNIVNSIIILDEVQSIPHRYWNLVRETFTAMARYLNCHFIFMTATMSLIFSEESKEIYELAKNKRKYFEEFSRITINAKRVSEKLTIDEYKALLSDDIYRFEEDDFLIVMNTIWTSIDVYSFIKEEFGDSAEIYYLSTNIIPKERLERIKKIKKSKNRKIIVSTQMIEAGVDIDIDRVYRDFGPMDSINQTAGRCNREWGDKKGLVTLVNLTNENHYDRSYAAYIYDNVLIEETRNALSGFEMIEEKEIFYLAEKYYMGLKNHGSDESQKLLDCIKELRYREAFESGKDDKNSGVFELIRQEFKTVDVFIEIDDDAAKVWQEYQSIKKIKDRFERKRKFNRHKKDLYMYVLSLPEFAVRKQVDIDEKDITFVSREMVFNAYDEDTGFMRDLEKDYFF